MSMVSRRGRGWARARAFCLAAGSYAVLFCLLREEPYAVALGVLPVASVAVVYGLRWGLAAAAAFFFGGGLLFAAFGHPAADALWRSAGVGNGVLLAGTGLGVGYLNAVVRSGERAVAMRDRVEAEIGRVIGSSLDIDEVYGPFAEQVRKLVRFDRISIALVDSDGDAFTDAYVLDEEMPGWRQGEVHRLSGTVVGRIAGNRSPVVMGDSPAAGSSGGGAGFPARFPSMAGVPLAWKGSVIGVLTLRSTVPNAYSGADVALLSRVASQISPAIENAGLHSRALEMVMERELLAEMSRAATVGVGTDELARRFLEMVGRRVKFDHAVVRMLDASTGRESSRVAVGAAGGEVPAGDRLDEVSARVLAFRTEVMDSGTGGEWGAWASVTLPLLSDREVIGVVSVLRRGGEGFRKEEEVFVKQAAAQIGPALDNARLIGERQGFAAIVEAHGDAILSADADGFIRYVNPAGLDILGEGRCPDVLGRHWREFFTAEDVRVMEGEGVPLARQRGSWRGRARLVGGDGDLRPVDVCVAVHRDRGGAVLGVSLSMRGGAAASS